MKMRGNICCCLVAFVLICNVTAAIIHKTLEEKNSVRLSCPHSVEGKVTWSRERDGTKVDILTADGGREIRHNDPGRRYSSETDKSLYIGRVTISDTGRYLCNNEPAVELTVIPSGTTRRDAAERTNITLKCPPDVGGSDVPAWSRDTVEIQQQRRFHVSPADNTLIITDLQPADSGLYYCDGKPAAYLTVSKAPPQDQMPHLGLMLGIVVPLPVLVIIIFILYFTQSCRFKRQGTEEINMAYDDIPGGLVFMSTNGAESFNRSTATYNMTDFLVEKKTKTFLPNESTYSLITYTIIRGNTKDWKQE